MTCGYVTIKKPIIIILSEFKYALLRDKIYGSRSRAIATGMSVSPVTADPLIEHNDYSKSNGDRHRASTAETAAVVVVVVVVVHIYGDFTKAFRKYLQHPHRIYIYIRMWYTMYIHCNHGVPRSRLRSLHV